MRQFLIRLAVLCLLAGAGCRNAGVQTPAGPGPFHVYLTWQGDTATTITVNAQTAAQLDATGVASPDVAPVQVYYDTASRAGKTTAYARNATGPAHQIAGLADKRWIHAIELTGLQPATDYYFTVGSATAGYSPEHHFRTLPADDRPLRLVTGGDMGVDEHVPPLLQQAAAVSPDLALIGGDIAYVNGNLDKVEDWDTWLARWQTVMVTPDGRMIPMILAVGNHEVNGNGVFGNYGQEPVNAPFYYGFFAQAGQRSYFSRRLGALAAVVVLDTDHTSRFDGEQTAFLETALAGMQETPYRFAIYHVPLYPGHREFMKEESAPAHAHWRPLFDKYRLTTAFENHDHVLKRTHLLRGDQIATDGDGTLYLGDGCWGAKPRSGRAERPYLAVCEPVRHLWIVDITRTGVTYRAVDGEGLELDRTVTPAPSPAAIAQPELVAP